MNREASDVLCLPLILMAMMKYCVLTLRAPDQCPALGMKRNFVQVTHSWASSMNRKCKQLPFIKQDGRNIGIEAIHQWSRLAAAHMFKFSIHTQYIGISA